VYGLKYLADQRAACTSSVVGAKNSKKSLDDSGQPQQHRPSKQLAGHCLKSTLIDQEVSLQDRPKVLAFLSMPNCQCFGDSAGSWTNSNAI